MAYSDLITALRETGLPLAEWAYEGQETPPTSDYLVVSLEGQGAAFWANLHQSERALEGTVDLFAYTDGRNNAAAVEEKLNGVDCSWYLNSVQYESDTGLIHYEWVFQMCAPMAYTPTEVSTNGENEVDGP